MKTKYTWTKADLKVLDEMADPDGYIRFGTNKDIYEKMQDLFRITCNINDILLQEESNILRGSLLIINKLKDDPENVQKNHTIKELNITGKSPEEVKDIIKDESLWGYIVIYPCSSKNKKSIAVIRALHTPKESYKNIVEFSKEGKKIITEEGRTKTKCEFDYWS